MSKRSLARRTTIADIAARAGVSKSTVSHALSGKRPISLATQKRIRAVIEEVGYRPSVVAQRLAGAGHTRTIGLVFPLSATLIAGTETEFIITVANAATAADYPFLLFTHLEGNPSQFERMVESGLVDGFILMKVHMQDPRVEWLRQAQIPFVLLGRCANNEHLSFVDVDIEAGVAAAIAHLARLGHGQIGYLPFVNDHDFGFAVRTLNSFHAHCADHQITPVVMPAQPTREGAAAACTALLQAAPTTTALLVRNETMAEGVSDAAATLNLHIPTDLALIGMGSSTHQFTIQQGALRLTWINIRAETMAVTATQFLIEALENGATGTSQRLVAPQLVIGESCGADRLTGERSLLS